MDFLAITTFCSLSRLHGFWLNKHSIYCLKWPATSSGLSITKKVRCLVARSVYYTRKQFQSIGQLKDAICSV